MEADRWYSYKDLEDKLRVHKAIQTLTQTDYGQKVSVYSGLASISSGLHKRLTQC